MLTSWPHWITRLPAITTSFPEGANGHLLACEHGQVVLWSFPHGATVPQHQHGPQIGLIVAGSIELATPDGRRDVAAGDSFALEDQVPHSARVAPGTLVIEVFADPDRHQPSRPQP